MIDVGEITTIKICQTDFAMVFYNAFFNANETTYNKF